MTDDGMAHTMAKLYRAAGLTAPTEAELAQAYQQGYQDGRRVAGEDAARYIWLRDSSLGQWLHPIVVSQQRGAFGMQYIGPLVGRSLDSAIDSALAKVTQPQPATKGE